MTKFFKCVIILHANWKNSSEMKNKFRETGGRVVKAIVLSDSHHFFNSIMDIIEGEGRKTIDLIIHAGDVHRDVEDMMAAYPEYRYEYVLGNNDYFTVGVPFDRVFSFDGHKVFLTHGHNYGVKCSLGRLLAQGKKLGAEICIFGHTHMRYFEQKDGICLLNPGSSVYSYAVLETKGDRLDIMIKER